MAEKATAGTGPAPQARVLDGTGIFRRDVADRWWSLRTDLSGRLRVAALAWPAGPARRD